MLLKNQQYDEHFCHPKQKAFFRQYLPWKIYSVNIRRVQICDVCDAIGTPNADAVELFILPESIYNFKVLENVVHI